MCERVLADPYLSEPQNKRTHPVLGTCPDEVRWIRVVTLSDAETVHNAFYDQRVQAVKHVFDKEHFSLYIGFRDGKAIESEEIRPGIVADYDSRGEILGLDIDDVRTIAEVDIPRANLVS